MAHTDDDRAAALAALEANKGNVRKTSREMRVSEPTLRRWRKLQNNPQENDAHKKATAKRMPQARASLSERFREFVHSALDEAPNKLHDSSMGDLFRAIGISVDKIQLLEGKPTGIEEVRGELTDDERAARVARLLDSARTRRAGQADTE